MIPAGKRARIEAMQMQRMLVAIAFAMLSFGSSANSEFCQLVDGNFLQDPMFDQLNSSGVPQYWFNTQHAGEKSFELEFDNGELTIVKTGTQPWLYFRERVAAKELAGKKMAFTAELKLDLQQAHTPTVGGGLSIVARSSSLQGRKLLLRSKLDHQPRSGKTDWHPVQVVVQLPRKTNIVEVGFLHQGEGTMQVRNPSFQLVDESSQPCAVSPNAILGIPQTSSGLR
jgi:hypothetical protein